MKVLILGGTRFMGHLLAWRLVAGGHRVTLFHRGTRTPPFADRVETLLGDRATGVLPSRLKGRAFDATVDFGALDKDSVEVSEDRTTIRLRLPEPQLQKADLDQADTRVVSRSRGIVDRIGDVFSGNPFDDSRLYQTAEKKLGDAAANSDLQSTAKANTERWLTTFLQAAGFTTVEVTWTKMPA